ncbi:MAG: ATP-dependent Clp protease ATP-binding subunit ClpB, partial [Hyphomicrobiaceae bacterium]
DAKTYLGEQGYDPVYGARPLKRFLQRELETRIGRKLIAGEIVDGSTVTVGLVDGKLDITTTELEPNLS